MRFPEDWSHVPVRVTPQRFHRILNVLAHRQPDLRVLLENVVNEHNINAILRTCDATGVMFVHYVSDRPLTIVPGISRGAAQWVDLVREPSVAEALDRLADAGYQIVAAHPASTALDFRLVDYTRPTVIVLGNEAVGLSEAALIRAHRRVRIPMYGMTRSLNVSVAAAVLLYEAERQRRLAGLYARVRWHPDQFRMYVYRWAVERQSACSPVQPGLK